jgi:cytochrome bd ubiquinol oxidase subunit I
MTSTRRWPGSTRSRRRGPPPVGIVFWAFRIMVGIGFLMLARAVEPVARWRGGSTTGRWLHRFALVMGPSGFVAVLAGWITTEVGRQPWTIYGLLRTADAARRWMRRPSAASLLAFVVVYFAVFGAGVWYILKLMAKPPHAGEYGAAPRTGPIRTAGITPGPARRTRREAALPPRLPGRSRLMDLTVIWAFIIAFAVFAYVVMDGFDLGIGILFPTFRVGQERDRR